MKISEIKSDEVRAEAVRLAILQNPEIRTKQIVLDFDLSWAFPWKLTPQGFDFWSDLHSGTTPNTPDLKLPEKNPSE
jgi:hypothetical protein